GGGARGHRRTLVSPGVRVQFRGRGGRGVQGRGHRGDGSGCHGEAAVRGLTMLDRAGEPLGLKTAAREVPDFGPAAPAGAAARGPRHVVGLDLGQVSDYSALAVVEVTEAADPAREGRRVRHHAVRHLQRWQLGTPYTDIVEEAGALLGRLPGAATVVDATGVGRAVVDLFRKANLPRLVSVTITGGDTVRHDARRWHVAKKQLVSVVQAALQTRRLKVAPGLREARTLQQELSTFKVKVNLATANESFEAWRERDHDDLVLAVALAVWHGEKGQARLTPFVWV